jgi:hypothetical protein
MTDPTDPPPPPAIPTLADRLHLVGRLQAQAIARPDPLAANVGVIAGDVAMFAHCVADRVRAGMANPNAGGPAASADADTFFKAVRQLDRMAQLEQRLADRGSRGG